MQNDLGGHGSMCSISTCLAGLILRVQGEGGTARFSNQHDPASFDDGLAAVNKASR